MHLRGRSIYFLTRAAGVFSWGWSQGRGKLHCALHPCSSVSGALGCAWLVWGACTPGVESWVSAQLPRSCFGRAPLSSVPSQCQIWNKLSFISDPVLLAQHFWSTYSYGVQGKAMNSWEPIQLRFALCRERLLHSRLTVALGGVGVLSSCRKGDGLSQAPQLGGRTETAPGSSLPLRHVAPFVVCISWSTFHSHVNLKLWRRKWQPPPVFLPGKSQAMLQEGGPLPGPETGLLSNTRKWIVRGDTSADKARNFIGKGHPGGEQEGEGTQEDSSVTRLAVLGFMDGISFWVVCSQSFWLRVLPGGARVVQSTKTKRRVLGGGRACGVSFWPFLNSSGCWWLISSVFLSRTSCRKTTHAHGCVVPGQGGGFQSVCFP